MDADSGADSSFADGPETGSSELEPTARRVESAEHGGSAAAEQERGLSPLPQGSDGKGDSPLDPAEQRVHPADAPPAVDRSSEGSGEQ
jgi:hypothetical protein